MGAGRETSVLLRVAFALSAVPPLGCASGDGLPPPAAAAPHDPACSRSLLDDPSEPDAPAVPSITRSPGPLVELSELVRPDAPKRVGAGPRRRIDLGNLSRKVDPPPPPGGIERATLRLRRDVPRPHLSLDLLRLWDREDATTRELVLAKVGHALARRKEEACLASGTAGVAGTAGSSACPELACLGKLKKGFDEEARVVRARRVSERRELVERLRGQVAAAGDRAPAGLLVALAGTLEDLARQDAGDDGLVAASLKEPIALYERAAALAGPASDVGWFAGYLRGVALRDTSAPERAREAFSLLARSSPPGWRAAHAAYEAAYTEEDPARRCEAFQRAVAVDEKGAPTREGTLGQWSSAALRAERPADALTANLLRYEELAQGTGEGTDGFLEYVADDVAEAFGRLVRPSLPPTRVPPAVFALFASRVAENAVRRFDAAQAVHAWRAILDHAPESREASGALAGLAEGRARAGEAGARAESGAHAEMEGRLVALLRDCGHDHLIMDPPLDLAMSVDAAARGGAKVSVRSAKAAPPSYFLRCLAARGSGYFVDAPADLTVKLTLKNF